MIYSFHHHVNWVKGGVETAMAYRARIFRSLGLDAKFIFTNTSTRHNIWDEASWLGFLDSEVLWLYGFFSDCHPSPAIYTMQQLEKTLEGNYIFSRQGSLVKYQFPDRNVYYNALLMGESSNFVCCVEMISNACLVRKDYYTYCRTYSEYYVPVNGRAELYLRRFFNEDGSVAYEEMIDGDMVHYKFPDRMLYSREELVEYMMSCLHFTENDVVLIEGVGVWGMDRAVFIQNAFPAKVGFIFHSNHFHISDQENIVWHSAFEYALAHPEEVGFYVTNTEAQSSLLREQFRHYKNLDVRVETIPAAYLDEIRMPEHPRKMHSIVTAGRLHDDKRTNWVVEAAVMARREIPDLTLDIYGEGYGEYALRELIRKLNCDSYVHLCGFQKLDEVYQNYDAYVSASPGETLGITLLEAIGSGLPIVGFDLPYGMQELVDDGKNGFRIEDISARGLANGIIRLFKEENIETFREHSYEKAKGYLTEQVEKKWESILC